MKIFMKYILRNIREHKLRGILIVFSLMISTFLLFINLVARDDIIYKTQKSYEDAFQGYDIIVSSKDSENPFFKEKDFNNKEIKTKDKLSAIMTFGVMDNEDSLSIKLYGCNREKYLNSGLFSIAEQNNFDVSRDDQILVSPQLAKMYGFKLGDKIPIQTQIGSKEYIVAAIGEKSGLFLSIENENLIVMTNFEVENISGQKNMINTMLLNLDDNTDIDKSIKTIEMNNKDFNVKALLDQEMVDMTIDIIRQILFIILALAIIMNYYVISSNAKVILLSRIPVVGTFRSVGVSKTKVNLILIIENFLYGIIGGTLGIVCGICFRETLLGALTQGTSGISMAQISAPINYNYMIFALLFAVVIQLISVLGMIYKIGNHSIKNLIFGELSSIQKVPKNLTVLGFVFLASSYVLYIINLKYNIFLFIIALIAAMAGGILVLPLVAKYFSLFFNKINKLLFGAASSLGARNISDSKIINSNMKLVVISLSVVLMIFITSASIKNVFVKAKEVLNFDILITGLGGQEDKYSKLSKVSGVDDINYLYAAFDNIKVNEKELNFTLWGFRDFNFNVKNIDGDMKNLKTGEVMMDDFYAIRNGYKIGDDLELQSDNFKSKKLKVKIVGTVDASLFNTSRNMIVFSEAQFIKDIADIPAVIYVTSDSNLDEMKKTLYKELSGEDIAIESVIENWEGQEQGIGGILNVVWIFLILSILLASIGLINNQVIGFIQRKREYAVLYSISMSRAQLNTMIFFEIMNSFFIGCVSGLALSLWMSRLMKGLLVSMGICINFSFQWLNIFGVIAIIFIMLILTALIPMFKILKMDVVREIKYE